QQRRSTWMKSSAKSYSSLRKNAIARSLRKSGRPSIDISKRKNHHFLKRKRSCWYIKPVKVSTGWQKRLMTPTRPWRRSSRLKKGRRVNELGRRRPEVVKESHTD